MEPLLSVHIDVDYPSKPGVLRDVQFDIAPGEILGLAGQSGSGKSTLALSIMRLLPARWADVRGKIQFLGRDLLSQTEKEMRRIRGREIGMALQAAASALNPSLRLEAQLKEAWQSHERSSWTVGLARTLETLEAMDLQCDAAFLRRYPGEISIGQAQRVILAMALLHRPALLIADEPTSALDLMAQAELLGLLRKVNAEFGTAMLFISHDLSSVASVCHRLCVMNAGSIVETGPPHEVFRQPRSEFTQSLLAAYRVVNAETAALIMPRVMSDT